MLGRIETAHPVPRANEPAFIEAQASTEPMLRWSSWAFRMMQLLSVYLDCVRRTWKAIAKNPWVVLLPMLYGLVLGLALLLAAPLGILGGFLVGMIGTAVSASFLYVVDELVSGSPVRPRELLLSVRRYFWPIMSVFFVFWVAQLLLSPLLTAPPHGTSISIGLMAVLFVLLNATPEVIYQKRTYGGLATLAESVSFIQRNWIEWLIPNIGFGAALWFGIPRLLALAPTGLGVLDFFAGPLLGGLLKGLVLFPIMLFRGHLFRELDRGIRNRVRYRP